VIVDVNAGLSSSMAEQRSSSGVCDVCVCVCVCARASECQLLHCLRPSAAMFDSKTSRLM